MDFVRRWIWAGREPIRFVDSAVTVGTPIFFQTSDGWMRGSATSDELHDNEIVEADAIALSQWENFMWEAYEHKVSIRYPMLPDTVNRWFIKGDPYSTFREMMGIIATDYTRDQFNDLMGVLQSYRNDAFDRAVVRGTVKRIRSMPMLLRAYGIPYNEESTLTFIQETAYERLSFLTDLEVLDLSPRSLERVLMGYQVDHMSDIMEFMDLVLDHFVTMTEGSPQHHFLWSDDAFKARPNADQLQGVFYRRFVIWEYDTEDSIQLIEDVVLYAAVPVDDFTTGQKIQIGGAMGVVYFWEMDGGIIALPTTRVALKEPWKAQATPTEGTAEIKAEGKPSTPLIGAGALALIGIAIALE